MMKSRYMLTIECEVCGGKIKRSIQDIVEKDIGKHKDTCPFCNSEITYELGLTPQDMEE